MSFISDMIIGTTLNAAKQAAKTMNKTKGATSYTPGSSPKYKPMEVLYDNVIQKTTNALKSALTTKATNQGLICCNTNGSLNNPSQWANGYLFPTGEFDNDVLKQVNDGIEFFQDPWQNFDRWYSTYLTNDELETREYVFFVRPELFLVQEVEGGGSSVSVKLCEESRVAYDPFMQYMFSYHQVILRSLCGEFGVSKNTNPPAAGSGLGLGAYQDGTVDINGKSLAIHAWIPYLVGRTESLQIPDYTIKTFNLVQPYTRYALPYSTSAIESQSGGTFDVTFKEDAQLRVHKLFYTWLYYMDGVMRNKFKPKDKFILYNALDYATSVYHIVCDVTATKILWWSKYTGVIPTSVPNSDLSFNKGGKTENKVTIPFAYFHHEALNPEILTDFNYNSLGYQYMRNVVEPKGGLVNMPFMSTYDVEAGLLGTNLVGRPFITSSPGGTVELRWAPPVGKSGTMC